MLVSKKIIINLDTYSKIYMAKKLLFFYKKAMTLTLKVLADALSHAFNAVT